MVTLHRFSVHTPQVRPQTARKSVLQLYAMETAELYNIFTQHPTITTDSRDCQPGSIFFALKGASFDGNRFAAAALEKGCAYAVVDDPQCATDSRFLLVDDCLRALQQLANFHRRALGTRIIGITGTNGKTTTKELTAAVLGEKYNVLYTQGNFNNDIGVPKTLLRLRPEHDVAVVEMGASHPGDIKTLVDIVEPDCGLITNVGRAHLQGFGSLEGVVRTKGEFYDYLRSRPGTTVFLHHEDERLQAIAEGLPTVEYGTAEGLFVSGKVESCSPLLTFSWKQRAGNWHRVESHLIGSYNLDNMLAAATVGLWFGVSAEQVDHALTAYTPSNNRSQLEQTASNCLIVDAYNANPTSMAAALRNFSGLEAGKKMAILGDMRELGEASHEEHQKAVDLMQQLGLEDIWLVGEEFGKTQCPYRKFSDVEAVKAAIADQQPQGYCILIKGSNGTRLFQLPGLL